MLVFNLYPFPVKQSNVIYSWLSLVALQRFNISEICLLGNKHQLIVPSLQRHGPWVYRLLQINDFAALDLAYDKVVKICVPQALIDNAVDEFESPIAFFNHYIKIGIESYRNWLFDEMKNLHKLKNIEAFITCCNDKTLEDVAKWLNIPVIHIEGGQIRRPTFSKDTFSFDFSGVNGNTEAKMRSVKGVEIFSTVPKFTQTDLLKTIVSKDTVNELESVTANEFEIGVLLQVEDDSNVIVYNNGISQLDVLYKALRIFPENQILIRNHPNAHFKTVDTSKIIGMPCGFGVIDNSISSLAFVKRCKRIFTLNSSVAIEGLLLDKPTWIFGESSLAFMAQNYVYRKFMNSTVQIENKEELLNWFIFCYLIPEELWFNEEYIKWRLIKPTELEIYTKHQSFWQPLLKNLQPPTSLQHNSFNRNDNTYLHPDYS